MSVHGQLQLELGFRREIGLESAWIDWSWLRWIGAGLVIGVVVSCTDCIGVVGGSGVVLELCEEDRWS